MFARRRAELRPNPNLTAMFLMMMFARRHASLSIAAFLLWAVGVPTALAAPAAGKAPAKLPGGWKLEWHDEFDGTKLDTTKWRCEEGVVRNRGSSQAYSKSCVYVRNGMLHLVSRAKKTANKVYEPSADKWPRNIKFQPFASGSVTTEGVRLFSYPGRLEFRARIPKATGVWPAIWTMHVNKYQWPANGEIDILEHISQEPNKVYSIFRWGLGGGQRECKVVRTMHIPNYSAEFHTYILEWDEQTMRILIDDHEVGRVNVADADYPNGDNPLRTPCYIIMNTAIGGPGTWAESPRPDQYPVTFLIDYVRFYKK